MKKLTKRHRICMKLKMLFIPDGPDGDRARGKLYEPFMKSVGANFKVGSQAFIFNPNKLIAGNHVYIGFNSYIGEGNVILEDEVLIGNFVSITASNHLIKENSFRFGGFAEKEIKIGRGSWLGSHSSITAGVTIGEGCLIASGAIVTKSFENGLIIGGIPAKEISTTSKFRENYGI